MQLSEKVFTSFPKELVIYNNEDTSTRYTALNSLSVTASVQIFSKCLVARNIIQFTFRAPDFSEFTKLLLDVTHCPVQDLSFSYARWQVVKYLKT
jgi:hypothetical protein